MSKNIRGFSSQWIGCQEINTIQTLFGVLVSMCTWVGYSTREGEGGDRGWGGIGREGIEKREREGM